MIKNIWNIAKRNVFIIICIILFIVMCFIIKEKFIEVFKELDTIVKTFVDNTFKNPLLTNILIVVTHIGSAVCVMSVFVITLLIFRNNIIRLILFLDLGSIGAVAFILKNIFIRPRPLEALIKIPTSYSFPSGHTFFAVGFYGLILYFILKSKINKWLKVLLTIVITLLIILIGFSRIYLGVHHFTDVIGGLVLGIFFLLFYINTYLYLKED